MKLNKGHYSSGTVIIHFLDKRYQEANFKSHLNSVLFCVNNEKYCQICTCSMWFYFTLLVCTHFCNEIEKCQLYKSFKYFSILWPMKNDVRFENVPWKICDFVSFPLFGLTLVIKWRNFDFESHWNTLIFFDKKVHGVRFEYVPWKNV